MEQLLSHDRKIAFHRSQRNPDEIPEQKLTFSYQDKYAKLVKELAGEIYDITTTKAEEKEGIDDGFRVTTQVKEGGLDTGLQTKVLLEVNEDYHDAQAVTSTLDSGMIGRLILCFSDKDNVIRELASRAIMQVAKVERGREYLIRKKLVVDVSRLFEDDEVKIRQNAYHTMLFLAEFLSGIDAIIDFEINVIQILVDRLVLETEEHILILVLRLLKVLLEGARA